MMRLRFRSRSWFMGALGVALLASPEARAEAAEPPVPAALREAAVPAEAWAARPARHPGTGAGAPAPEAALELRRSAPLPAEHPAESDPFEVERQVDRVVVVKSERQLYLFDGPLLLRSYPVALGFSPEGAKQVQGDGKTPEGAYVLDSRKADSDFHRAIPRLLPERTRPRARCRFRPVAGRCDHDPWPARGS